MQINLQVDIKIVVYDTFVAMIKMMRVKMVT